MVWVRTAVLVLAAAWVVVAGRPAAAREETNLRLALAAGAEAPADQSPRPLRRARTRIDVTPARPMHRECTSRLEQEFRPSGTVIVPRLRCVWVR